eukprot:CAMPEP_0184859358 /NCGR_PEP_ID=MMETSP0580-20130426/4360_1 /TAXON_ID=1118495 /ORGANISM="Dactyliosolen fragilissimus" /LENGTH=508 /DNA_ID=CAMNT_0027355955 /DNA_START=63 /DNA_END=1589 /DNA_ORIENTATION=+
MATNVNTTRKFLQRLTFHVAVAIVFVSSLFSVVNAGITGKKELERIEKENLRLKEELRLSKFVILNGQEIQKELFYIMFTMVMVVTVLEVRPYLKCSSSSSVTCKTSTTSVSESAIGTETADIASLKGNRINSDNGKTVDFVIVGCGLPKRGMGWYHLTQILEMPNVNVRGVVEPFFCNPDLCQSPPKSFSDLVSSLKTKGVPCVSKISDLGPFTKTTICLIAGRTVDNPKLFTQCITNGAKVIYLEKPGAPSVPELVVMKNLAEANNVKVYIGYNKNVTPYVQKALNLKNELLAKDPSKKAEVFFCHNNSYEVKDLPECFSRNAEGMMKNMAVHEMALLVTFFGVTVDTIAKFQVNKSPLFSEQVTVWKEGTSMPNPEYITDFSRVAFRITTKEGTSVSVMADRCGGNVSFAAVKGDNGEQVQKFEFPDSDTMARVDELIKNDPEMMPYFFVQSDDYAELKNRVVDATLNGTNAEGVATIQIGIDALKLAEYSTKELRAALEKKTKS